MTKKVAISISLIALIVFVAFLGWKYTTRSGINVPIGVFMGEKSDIEEIEHAILGYIAKNNLRKQNIGNKEILEEYINKNLTFLKEQFIGIKINGNEAIATLGSEISPYGTRFYNLLKKENKWEVVRCFYFKDLPDREKKELFNKLSALSNELTKLEPEQVVYKFLTKNLRIDQFGLATIEERKDTECKVKVPLKDGRIIEFLLIRAKQTGYSIRPWQVKGYKFIKP